MGPLGAGHPAAVDVQGSGRGGVAAVHHRHDGAHDGQRDQHLDQGERLVCRSTVHESSSPPRRWSDGSAARGGRPRTPRRPRAFAGDRAAGPTVAAATRRRPSTSVRQVKRAPSFSTTPERVPTGGNPDAQDLGHLLLGEKDRLRGRLRLVGHADADQVKLQQPEQGDRHNRQGRDYFDQRECFCCPDFIGNRCSGMSFRVETQILRLYGLTPGGSSSRCRRPCRLRRPRRPCPGTPGRSPCCAVRGRCRCSGCPRDRRAPAPGSRRGRIP